MLTVIWIAAVMVGFLALAYVNAAGWLWTAVNRGGAGDRLGHACAAAARHDRARG